MLLNMISKSEQEIVGEHEHTDKVERYGWTERDSD